MFRLWKATSSTVLWLPGCWVCRARHEASLLVRPGRCNCVGQTRGSMAEPHQKQLQKLWQMSMNECFQWPFTTLLATLDRALCCFSGTGDQEVAQFLECFRSFKTSVSTNSNEFASPTLRSMGLFLSMQLVGWWGILTAGQSKPICWYWKAPGTT